MLKEKSSIHLAYWSLGSVFIGLINAVTWPFFADIALVQGVLGQIGMASAMVGFTCMAILAHNDGWYVPSAGFIVMAIAQGVFFSSMSIKTIQTNYEVGVSGILFMLPAIIMVSYYSHFPLWLRLAGLLSLLPFIYVLVSFYNGTYKTNMMLETFGYAFFQFITTAWAWFMYRNELQKSKS